MRDLRVLYYYLLWLLRKVPHRPQIVMGTFLGRSEVPNTSKKDKQFVSELSDHICDFLEDAYSMGRITKQKRDNWYAALGKYIPDLRQKVIPKKKEVFEEYLELHKQNVAKNGFGATPMIIQLRNSLK